MALVRATPLLTTIAQVVDLTSVQDLANLEVDGEFSTADTLLKAHEWIYDRLKRRFPTAALAVVTNTTELERACAFRFLEVVLAGGYLGGSETSRDYWGAQARDEVDGFQPEYSDGQDVPRASSEGIPVVRNLTSSSRGPLFGGQLE